MVEKVSEVSINVAMNGDSTSDDNTLLKQIKKKKYEQGDELLFTMLPLSSLVRLTAALAQGGIQPKTESQAVKKDVSASLEFVFDTWQTKKEDGLRRLVTLVHAGRNTLDTVTKNQQFANTQQPQIIAGRNALDTVTKNQQFANTQQPQIVADTNSMIGNKTNQEVEVETGGWEPQLQTKDDTDEVKWLWQGTKPLDNLLPKLGDASVQSKKSPAMLQPFKNIVSSVSESKGENGNQKLEVNYQFQRWSGDHSVKVSVPTEAGREGKITLLPSDTRTADVLHRNMSHLIGLTPELLRPQQEQGENQQRRQQQLQDEELE